MKKNINELLLNELEGANNLKKYVINDILEHCDNDNEYILNYIKDVINYGCVSGIVSSLIYYSDTEKFFNEYSNEILELLDVKKEECEPYKGKFNKNNLSWFAYEEICKQLYYSIEE